MRKRKKTDVKPNRLSGGRPRLYDWDEWFSEENKKAKGFVVTKGEDFDAKMSTMTRYIRLKAKEYDWNIKTWISDNEIHVDIVQ